MMKRYREHASEMKRIIREGYARIARQDCLSAVSDELSYRLTYLVEDTSREMGYTKEDIKSVPEGASLYLGCDNPVSFASLQRGEIALDLGSAVGLDCFLIANKVGEHGRVVGVDMTPEMIEKARENAAEGNYRNVEFRLGEIESLPVDDNSIDVVISNCVINLVPNKKKAFTEALRVLKPGGRIVISDIVLSGKSEKLSDSSGVPIGRCVGYPQWAVSREEYLQTLKSAGFHHIRIINEIPFSKDYMFTNPALRAIITSIKLSPDNLKWIADLFMGVRVLGNKPNEA